MSANDKQVGGSHYRAEYQHWDWVTEHGITYLAGCATKYLLRWRKKNGVQDLEKARHYVEKMIDIAELHALEYSSMVFYDPDENLKPESSAYEDTKNMMASAGVSIYDMSWHAIMDIVMGDFDCAVENIDKLIAEWQHREKAPPVPAAAPAPASGPLDPTSFTGPTPDLSKQMPAITVNPVSRSDFTFEGFRENKFAWQCRKCGMHIQLQPTEEPNDAHDCAGRSYVNQE